MRRKQEANRSEAEQGRGEGVRQAGRLRASGRRRGVGGGRGPSIWLVGLALMHSPS